MKIITKNLINFAIWFFIGAILFRYALAYFLSNHLSTGVWVSAVVYFLYNFTIGWLFGKRDHESLPLFDIGFRFHLTSYILFNGISQVWVLAGFTSQYESYKSVLSMGLFWGIGLLFHFFFFLKTRKNAIKGLKKDELFE